MKAKESNDITTYSLQSVYDEDATYRKKGTIGQSGYVLEIAEICSKDNLFKLITRFIKTLRKRGHGLGKLLVRGMNRILVPICG